MNNYSPIERLIIKDFRNIQDIQIEFSESPIVTLVGDNEAGKSSILKALQVCALHYNPREQKGYIRTGAPFFGIGIQLASGESIVRIKTKDNINKYEVRYADGTVWSTTKIAEGLPVQVKELMGMVEEPETKEYLQVRTYENKLLMAYTPASTNYKVMYDALKVGQITRAIRNGTEEANEIRQRIISNTSSIRTLENNVSRIEVLDLNMLTEMRKAVTVIKGQLIRIKEAVDIVGRIEELNEQLGVLRLIDTYKLSDINEITVTNINNGVILYNSLAKLSKELYDIKDTDSLETINILQCEYMKSAISVLECIKDMKKKVCAYDDIENTEEIDIACVSSLENALAICDKYTESKHNMEKYYGIAEVQSLEEELRVVSSMSNISEIYDTIRKLNEDMSNNSREIARLENEMKQSGVRVETCPNCGTDIIVA